MALKNDHVWASQIVCFSFTRYFLCGLDMGTTQKALFKKGKDLFWSISYWMIDLPV